MALFNKSLKNFTFTAAFFLCLALFAVEQSMAQIGWLDCEGVTYDLYELQQEKAAGGSLSNLEDGLFKTAFFSRCLGKEKQALKYFNQAADLDFIPSLFILAEYYRKKRKFSCVLCEEAEDSNTARAVEFYRRAVDLIHQKEMYPQGRLKVYELELYVSYNSFFHLPRLYYAQYLSLILDRRLGSEVLQQMKDFAVICRQVFKRGLWVNYDEGSVNRLRAICTGTLLFSESALALEEKTRKSFKGQFLSDEDYHLFLDRVRETYRSSFDHFF